MEAKINSENEVPILKTSNKVDVNKYTPQGLCPRKLLEKWKEQVLTLLKPISEIGSTFACVQLLFLGGVFSMTRWVPPAVLLVTFTKIFPSALIHIWIPSPLADVQGH